MTSWSDIGAALPAGLGAAVVMLVQQAAKFLRVRSIASRVRKEAAESGGPEFGTIGWVWKEVVRERGARHALRDRHDQEIADLRERLAQLEGRTASGEQDRVAFDNDTDPAPPLEVRRASRRSRP
jgi:hypothetical protein